MFAITASRTMACILWPGPTRSSPTIWCSPFSTCWVARTRPDPDMPLTTLTTGRSTMVWTLTAAVALLWPARIIGVLDGVPLDGRLEAIVIGLAVPALWWLDRG